MLKNWVLVVHDVCLKDIFIVQMATTTTLYVSLSMPSGYILALHRDKRKVKLSISQACCSSFNEEYY
jgi:hypothetical protein